MPGAKLSRLTPLLRGITAILIVECHSHRRLPFSSSTASAPTPSRHGEIQRAIMPCAVIQASAMHVLHAEVCKRGSLREWQAGGHVVRRALMRNFFFALGRLTRALRRHEVCKRISSLGGPMPPDRRICRNTAHMPVRAI